MSRIAPYLLLVPLLLAQSSLVAQERMRYKQVDSIELYLEIFYPANMSADSSYPAMIFFFGGGWIGGSISHFEPQARYFSQRGLITIRADYRVQKRQQTTPFESLKDAKSAMRYIRANAEKLQIDPSRIAASGGSAGGHLAAATALIEGYNESTDDLSVSCIPNALVLFNPVIDNGPGGYGYDRVGAAYKNFSPLHNIKKGAPPTIVFLGTEDNLIPVETARYYQKVMQKVGNRCELYLYKGQGHGFFNYQNFKYYKKTVAQADQFLQSLGYLTPEPAVKIK